jgi:hypothetical protein
VPPATIIVTVPLSKPEAPSLPATGSAGHVDARAGRPPTLSGSLQAISALDLLEWLCSNRKSWTLRVWNGGIEGQVVVVQGELLHARCGPARGLPALGEILGYRRGCFDLVPVADAAHRSLRGHWRSLLLAAVGLAGEQLAGEPTRAGCAPLAEAWTDAVDVTG